MSESHESIVRSSIRYLFKGFFLFFGLLLAVIVFLLIFSATFWGKSTPGYTNKNSIEILPNLEGNTALVPEKDPVILQIDIHNIIGFGETRSEVIQSQLVESRKDFLKNDRVKGILLHMNTRGGAVTDTDDIYRMLVEYKKKYGIPVYAFIEGINASGGVYISCAADKIFATPASIIGSVGIISGPYINIYKTLEKIGVESLTITEGKDKDALNPLRPWNKSEAENIAELSEYYYNMFVDVVAKARPKLTKEKLISTYGALVFPASKAEGYGYIDDGHANRSIALKALLEAAHISPNESYQLVKLNHKKNIIEELFENSALFKGKINHQIKLEGMEGKTNDKLSFLYVE